MWEVKRMKTTLLALCMLVLLPGCSYLLPQFNQPPKAYINAITPSEVTQGEVVTFSGHGTDVDGEVVAYRWRSDLDGQLGTTADFETASLSVGDHAIYLMVQDNNDVWSAEVRGGVKVLPAVPAPAKINSFTSSATTIAVGDSVTLSWNVSNAGSAVIDNGVGTVSAVGSVAVSPATTTTYKISATGGGSTATAQLTVTVQNPVLDIVFFDADPESVPSGDVSVLTWETTGATEVRILPVIGEVAKSGSINVTVTGDQAYIFTLIATNGDDTLTADVEIESYVIMPTEYEVTLVALLSESGYVRSTGAPWAEYIYVGDDNNNIGIQGFVSFDISDIPDDAQIKSVEVDMSDHASLMGTPFDDLGCLKAYAHNYGTLDGGDYYTLGLPTAIGTWCDLDDLDTPEVMSGFKTALQNRVGGNLFQFRLQFTDDATDEENDNDIVPYHTTYMPSITVRYYSYE